MRLFISAGGTGGGIYPALSVIESLRRLAPELELHFIGSQGGMEESLVPRNLLAAYHAVSAAPLHGINRREQLRGVLKLAQGSLQVLRLVGKLKPRALFLTGGFATFPAAMGCWLRGVPVAAYVPDIEPALGVKVIGRFARRIFATVPETSRYFGPRQQQRVVAVGYPLREEVKAANREVAISHFGLDPSRKTLLVFGGSRGARSINTALGEIVAEVVKLDTQIIHISGELDWEAVEARREALPNPVKEHYHAFPYLHQEMGLALAAADLAVSRSGASVLGEFPYFSIPAVLVPYPHAWRYQKVNADWLVERGAAVRLDDENLSAQLLPTLQRLLIDPMHLKGMSDAAAELYEGDAADKIARSVLELAKLPDFYKTAKGS